MWAWRRAVDHSAAVLSIRPLPPPLAGAVVEPTLSFASPHACASRAVNIVRVRTHAETFFAKRLIAHDSSLVHCPSFTLVVHGVIGWREHVSSA